MISATTLAASLWGAGAVLALVFVHLLRSLLGSEPDETLGVGR